MLNGIISPDTALLPGRQLHRVRVVADAGRAVLPEAFRMNVPNVTRAGVTVSQVRSFEIAVPDAVLDDLHVRLDRTRPARDAVAGWLSGTDPGYLASFVTSWAGEYQWRDTEPALNGLPQLLAHAPEHRHAVLGDQHDRHVVPALRRRRPDPAAAPGHRPSRADPHPRRRRLSPGVRRAHLHRHPALARTRARRALPRPRTARPPCPRLPRLLPATTRRDRTVPVAIPHPRRHADQRHPAGLLFRR